jgi:hypothetical protein
VPREAEPVDAEPANADELAARFDTWAKGVVRNLPLYRRLCEGVAGDREVAARLLISPRPAQRIPNLLLAAVHDVVLAGDHHPDAEAIRRWYGSVTPEPWVVGRGVDDPWPHFRALALDHEVVAERIGTCSTQTNEVGRCAPLLAALAGVGAGTTGRGIGLVEIGASAGLNLLLDRYGYCYTRSRVVPGTGDALSADESDGEALWLAPNAPLVLTCALRGPCTPPLPEVMPVIDYRVGLDLHPVDPGERAQARWLVACQWPDQPERVHRARTAIALSHGRRPRVVVGDAVDGLAELVRSVPDGSLPVVVATWVLSYIGPDRQRDLMAVLGELATERDLSFVYSEQPELVPGLGVPPRPDGRPDGTATALVRIDWRGGEGVEHRLGDQHPHGTWLEWLGPQR